MKRWFGLNTYWFYSENVFILEKLTLIIILINKFWSTFSTQTMHICGYTITKTSFGITYVKPGN